MPENGRVTQEELYKAMTELQSSLMKWRDWADERFVSKGEFAPVRAIAYGIVAIVGTAVFGALVAMAMRQPVP